MGMNWREALVVLNDAGWETDDIDAACERLAEACTDGEFEDLEIEDLLHAHDRIAECAVVGLPDDERGELACAVVVTAGDEPLTFDDMSKHLRSASLSKHKIPERLEFVEMLPRNATGKILKKDLRARFG